MNNNCIKFYESPTGYHMDFLNGSIEIPKIPGAYNIATGCGSGKTTIIKQIMSQKYNNGVIVFCKTIKECNELYDYIIQIAYDSNGKLTPNDIINLCSEPRLEKIGQVMRCTNGVDLHWKDNLELISKKKIVIATHSVLMNTPINFLMKLSNTMTKADIINEGMCGVAMEIPVREFVLIDELPLNDPIQKTYKASDLMYLVDKIDMLVPNPNSSNVIPDFRMECRYKTYHSFSESYKMLCNLNSDLRIKLSDNELNSYREDMILSIMYNSNLGDLMTKSIKSGRLNPTLKFKYNFPNIIKSAGSRIKTNVWLFEGTGDITLTKPSRSGNTDIPVFRFISYPWKYRGEDIDIIKIPNYLKSRNIEIDKMFSKKDEILNMLEKNIDLLEKIIRLNKETLIITWKNLRAKYVTGDKEYNENLSKFILNDEFNLPEYYKNKLEGRLIGTGCKFHIIHYGSGLDLSTNEFMNCDSVIRMGLFQIPGYALDDINDNMCTGMNMYDFILYQNVQALSRTRIRNHRGETVRFYISDDFNDHSEVLGSYLINEGCKVRMIDATLSNIQNRTRENIMSLISYDKNILKSILSGSSYIINISLDKIFELIPMSKKESRKYNSICNELYKLGIIINIV